MTRRRRLGSYDWLANLWRSGDGATQVRARPRAGAAARIAAGRSPGPTGGTNARRNSPAAATGRTIAATEKSVNLRQRAAGARARASPWGRAGVIPSVLARDLGQPTIFR